MSKVRAVSVAFAVITATLAVIMLAGELIFQEETAKLIVVPTLIAVLTLSGLTIGSYFLERRY